jgi:Fuc2NAc and GlcNAc transferase
MQPAILIPAAALMSFLLTGLATWYAGRRGLIDLPGERHSHTVATPRGGGAGLTLTLLLFSLLAFSGDGGFWLHCALPGFAILSLLGWWDDHASLSAQFRFFIQLAVSLYLIACSVHSGWLGGVLQLACAGLFLLWMTNLYNFMDGSNGMAGVQGVFAGMVLACLFEQAGDRQSALAAALLAACCLGFLPWNLGRARVFMGDTGSLALGFALGTLLIYGVASEAFGVPVALMVMLVFLTDGTLTL